MPVHSLKEGIIEIKRDTSTMQVFFVEPDDKRGAAATATAGETAIAAASTIGNPDTDSIAVIGSDTVASNKERLPCLIIVHEIFGVNEHIRDVARRFARHGMKVFAPDLFSSSPLWPQKEEERENLDVMRKVWASIPDSELMADLDRVYAKIQTLPGCSSNVGVIGYCMGGAISLMFGCHEPRLSYVIDYYGRIRYGTTLATKPKDPVDYIVPLKAPVLALFAGKDELITAEHIAHFSQRMVELGKSFQLKVYEDASHAFFNDRRPNYNAPASEDAWQRTLAFINVNTKGVSSLSLKSS
jgi:carboxymethylenebutenolidase